MSDIETPSAGWLGDDAIGAGVRAGLARVVRDGVVDAGLEFVEPPADLRETMDAVRDLLLEHRVVPYSERGTALFAELATVATIVRSASGEPPPDRYEVERYLEETVRFVRCYWHA